MVSDIDKCHSASNTGVVDLIASGYEWNCPKCDKLNTECEVYSVVRCVKCNTKYDVGETSHAYH